MNFTAEEKKKLNKFVDKYEYLLKEDDYVTFLEEYRKQNTRDKVYYAFVNLVKDSFGLDIEWFIENDPDFFWLNYFESDSKITRINIPAGVTKIGVQAFSYCRSLTTVIISEASWLTEIGSYAFFSCSSLTSIYIPNSVTKIGINAFSECSSLKTVSIGENSQLTTIRDFAFADCPYLTSIIIPDSVTTIGSFAFSGCRNLTIYCEASSKPRTWSSDWNGSDRPVVWGYKKNKNTKGN